MLLRIRIPEEFFNKSIVAECSFAINSLIRVSHSQFRTSSPSIPWTTALLPPPYFPSYHDFLSITPLPLPSLQFVKNQTLRPPAAAIVVLLSGLVGRGKTSRGQTIVVDVVLLCTWTLTATIPV
jgi:hypothetical protein